MAKLTREDVERIVEEAKKEGKKIQTSTKC